MPLTGKDRTRLALQWSPDSAGYLDKKELDQGLTYDCPCASTRSQLYASFFLNEKFFLVKKRKLNEKRCKILVNTGARITS